MRGRHRRMTAAPAYQRMHTTQPAIPDVAWDLDCMTTKTSPRMRSQLLHSSWRFRARLHSFMIFRTRLHSPPTVWAFAARLAL